jgi:hypothetical protein
MLLQALQVQQPVGELGLVWAQLEFRQQVLVLVRKVPVRKVPVRKVPVHSHLRR